MGARTNAIRFWMTSLILVVSGSWSLAQTPAGTVENPESPAHLNLDTPLSVSFLNPQGSPLYGESAAGFRLINGSEVVVSYLARNRTESTLTSQVLVVSAFDNLGRGLVMQTLEVPETLEKEHVVAFKLSGKFLRASRIVIVPERVSNGQETWTLDDEAPATLPRAMRTANPSSLQMSAGPIGEPRIATIGKMVLRNGQLDCGQDFCCQHQNQCQSFCSDTGVKSFSCDAKKLTFTCSCQDAPVQPPPT